MTASIIDSKISRASSATKQCARYGATRTARRSSWTSNAHGPWEIERIVLPDALCLMAGALKQSRQVLEGLAVDAAAMRRNIEMTQGQVMSEAVMMGLGSCWGRESAQDRVDDICRER